MSATVDSVKPFSDVALGQFRAEQTRLNTLDIVDPSTIVSAQVLDDGSYIVGRKANAAAIPFIEVLSDRVEIDGHEIDELTSAETQLLNTMIMNAGSKLTRTKFNEHGFDGNSVEFLQAMYGLMDKLQIADTDCPALITAQGKPSNRAYKIDAIRIADKRQTEGQLAEVHDIHTAGSYKENPEVAVMSDALSEPAKNLLIDLLQHEFANPKYRILQRRLLESFPALPTDTQFEKEQTFFQALAELRTKLLEASTVLQLEDAVLGGQKALKLEYPSEMESDDVLSDLTTSRVLDFSDVAPFVGIDKELYKAAQAAMPQLKRGGRVSREHVNTLVEYVQAIDFLERAGELDQGNHKRHFVRQANSALQCLADKFKYNILDFANRFSSDPAKIEELIIEGQLGLLDAIRKWDLSHDVHFGSYALKRVHGSIVDFLRKEGGYRQLAELRRELFDARNYDTHGNSRMDAEYWQKMARLESLLVSTSLDQMVGSEADDDLYEIYDASATGDPAFDDLLDDLIGSEVEEDVSLAGGNGPRVRAAITEVENIVRELPERARIAVALRLGLTSLLDTDARRWMTSHQDRLTDYGGMKLMDIGEYLGFTESRAVQIVKPVVDKISRSDEIRGMYEGKQ